MKDKGRKLNEGIGRRVSEGMREFDSSLLMGFVLNSANY